MAIADEIGRPSCNVVPTDSYSGYIPERCPRSDVALLWRLAGSRLRKAAMACWPWFRCPRPMITDVFLFCSTGVTRQWHFARLVAETA